MKPVQFLGFPAVPGGLKLQNSPCLCVGEEAKSCIWKFDSFNESIDVVGLQGWHSAIPSKFKLSGCKTPKVSTTSSSSVNFLSCQDYLDRGIHRFTRTTGWTSDALETMRVLCQENGVAFFYRFLKGTNLTMLLTSSVDRWTNNIHRHQNRYMKRAKLIKKESPSHTIPPFPPISFYVKDITGKKNLWRSEWGLNKIPSETALMEGLKIDFFGEEEELLKGYMMGYIKALSLKYDANMKLPKLIRMLGGSILWKYLGIIVNQHGQTVGSVSSVYYLRVL